MLGDHAVLERYTEARRRFAESEHEVVRQTSSAQKLEMELRQVERQVELRRGEVERLALDEEVERARRAEQQATEELARARRSEEEARTRWEGAHRRHVLAAERLGGLESRFFEVDTLPVRDLDSLSTAAEEAARAVFAGEAAETAARGRVAAQRQTVDRLRAGLAVYPPEVDRTLAALADRGIAAELLAARLEAVEDLDGAQRSGSGGGPGLPGRGEALEAALGDARFALLVGPGQEEEVLSLARSHDFPGPVYGGERTDRPERAGPLDMQAGTPVWLRSWPDRVELRADGTWRDERGLWGAPPRGRVLGAAGRQAALARVRRAMRTPSRSRSAQTRTGTPAAAARSARFRTARPG